MKQRKIRLHWGKKGKEDGMKRKSYWFAAMNVLGVFFVLWRLVFFGINYDLHINHHDVIGIFILIIMACLMYGAGKRAKHKTKFMGAFFAILFIVIEVTLRSFQDQRIFRLINIALFGCSILLLKAAWDYHTEIDLRREYLKRMQTVGKQETEKKTVEDTMEEQQKEVSEKRLEEQQKEVLNKRPREQTEEWKEVVTERIDVNNCSAEDLVQLPGISMVTAKRMIELRQQQGSFLTVDEFIMKSGIKPHFANDVIKWLTISTNVDIHKDKVTRRKLDI